MTCDDCKKEYGMIMVKDPVWLFATRHEHRKWELSDGGHPAEPHIFTTDISYCKQCIEKRIGRELRLLDMVDCVANKLWNRRVKNEVN